MRASFLIYSLLAALPLASLVAGCGGGSDSGSLTIPNPTRTPTPTAGPPLNAPVNFGNGQTGTLALSAQGITVIGTLQVNAIAASGRGAQAIPRIPSGTYRVAGTLRQPRGFLATGKFPSPLGAFVIQGALPLANDAGFFTLTVGDESITGTYPVQPAPAA